MSTADECRERLERAGWSVREEAPRAGALGCTVTGGHPGGQGFWCWGSTREVAWRNACRQAEALGLLPPC